MTRPQQPNAGFARRRLLQMFGAAAVAPMLGVASRAHADTASRPAPTHPVLGRIIAMSDLHSSYERTGQLLAAIEAEIASHPVPHLIAIDGDIFELGNVVAKRSDAVIDWAFLKALAERAPTVVNIGNHETDIVEDLADTVARLRDCGITVITNIVDARTGQGFAPSSAIVPMGDLKVSVTGLSTASVNTYPKPLRETLVLTDPVAWARENLLKDIGGDQAAGADFTLVFSHAGVVADRAILPMLPDGVLLIGGHDHLLFSHAQGRTRYVHTGAWANSYTVATLSPDHKIDIAQVPVLASATPSPVLASLIATTLAQNLTDADRAVIGHNAHAETLGQTGHRVGAIMAKALGADLGFIGHTTLGTGLPAGDITQYAFDSVVRFDGSLMTAEVDAATLAAILTRCNQDGEMSLSARTGDFLYAGPETPPAKTRYRIVTTGWSAMNQKSYFGREDLTFTEVHDVKLKTVVAAALGAA